MPETKTPEEILQEQITFRSHLNIGRGLDKSETLSCAIDAMTEYASQQSRSTAIGFWKWAMEKYIAHSPMGFWDGKVPSDENGISWISPESAYDLYLQSLNIK